MSITALHPTRLDRTPTDEELFPYTGKVGICIYCGAIETDEDAENRTADHIQRDLLAIHRTNEGLKATFGIDHPGYQMDVYDLLCELDAASAPALAVSLVAEAVAR